MSDENPAGLTLHFGGEETFVPDNVVKGRFGEDHVPMRSGRISERTCWHRESIVDAEARRVQCGTCHVDLDPIAVLAEIARQGEWVLALRKEKRKLEGEIDALKADAKRLRDQRKRLGGLTRQEEYNARREAVAALLRERQASQPEASPRKPWHFTDTAGFATEPKAFSFHRARRNGQWGWLVHLHVGNAALHEQWAENAPFPKRKEDAMAWARELAEAHGFAYAEFGEPAPVTPLAVVR